MGASSRMQGARVIGTSSGANLTFVKFLGVRKAVDRTEDPLEAYGQRENS